MRWVLRLQTAASSDRPSASSCIGEPDCLRCLQRLPHIGRAASPTRSRFSAPGFPPRSLFAASSCADEPKRGISHKRHKKHKRGKGILTPLCFLCLLWLVPPFPYFTPSN